MSLLPYLIAATAEYNDRMSDRFVHYEKPLQSAEAAKRAWDKAEAKRLRKQQKRIAK